MPSPAPPDRYRFGTFEADRTTGELRRQGLRIKLHAQPFQILFLLLDRPNQLLTREEITQSLWPDGTFVDFDHGVHSAINRLREALGDKAANPRFVETVARKGYRFIAPVEAVRETRTGALLPPAPEAQTSNPPSNFLDRVLATPHDLPNTPHTTARTLFTALQLMYLGFYIGTLANLPEINDLLSPLHFATETFLALIATAACLIPVRLYLTSAILFKAPHLRARYRRLWPWLLPFDLLWSAAPFLLLHHISPGLALACMAPLVYAPFAQRSLLLMSTTPASANQHS